MLLRQSADATAAAAPTFIGVAEFTPEAVTQMRRLAAAMRSEIKLKDRRHFMTVLRSTFRGRHAVAWFRCML